MRLDSGEIMIPKGIEEGNANANLIGCPGEGGEVESGS